MKTTVGQLLVNDALPEDLRDYGRELDAKGVRELFSRMTDRPDDYRKSIKALTQLGGDVSHTEGVTLSLKDLRPAKAKLAAKKRLTAALSKVMASPTLTEAQKNDKIVELSVAALRVVSPAVLAESQRDANTLALFVDSKTRGNAGHLNQLRGMPMLVTDHRSRPVPVPIMNSFSEGLNPAETWATSFGVRKGYFDIKQATPKAGYFGKQLANSAHKLVVSRSAPMEGTGLMVDSDDPDNIGSVLARDYGEFKAGQPITPSMLKSLIGSHKRIMIHSPIASPAEDGVPQWAVGVRERGTFADYGENVGIPAAQTIAEPLSQTMISSKHIAGAVGGGGKGSSVDSQKGFYVVERMANIPKSYADYAPVAAIDGVISGIEPAQQGGQYVKVGEERFYVPPHQEVTLKRGDRVEAGDVLSSGVPNPAEVVRHKGIGEGRRYFLNTLSGVLRNSGVNFQRRNLELVTRGLINHIKIKDMDEVAGMMPDDIVEYDRFAAKYVPREGARMLGAGSAVGKYLERPVLHYSIGTRITPRVVDALKEAEINDVMVHDNEPAFEPNMVRAVDIPSVDDDWMVRMSGFGLQKSLLKAVHEGATSDEAGPSYIPRLARGVGMTGN